MPDIQSVYSASSQSASARIFFRPPVWLGLAAFSVCTLHKGSPRGRPSVRLPLGNRAPLQSHPSKHYALYVLRSRAKAAENEAQPSRWEIHDVSCSDELLSGSEEMLHRLCTLASLSPWISPPLPIFITEGLKIEKMPWRLFTQTLVLTFIPEFHKLTERKMYLKCMCFKKKISKRGSFTLSYLFKQLKINSGFQKLLCSTGTMLHETVLTESYRLSLKNINRES